MARLNVILPFLACLSISGCSDSNDQPSQQPAPNFDFSAAHTWIEQFIDEEAAFDGAGLIVVSRDHGILHTQSFGTHTPGMLYMLASVSKVPSWPGEPQYRGRCNIQLARCGNTTAYALE